MGCLPAAFCEDHADVEPSHQVGVAEVDITPDYPVRLSGFGFRRAESEGVTQRIWAKALAFSDPDRGPAILITTDNLGVPSDVTQEVARHLKEQIGLHPDRLAITASHTHTAPMLSGVAPTLFSIPIPPAHQANIDRYTREFTEKLIQVAVAAFEDIRPSAVSWGIGQVGFAMNRRTAGGPVDHDLPTLVVRDLEGAVRAIYFSYACHCVTLSHNHISGDWAGYAMEHIESDFPGVIALSSVGCGADSNPNSGVVGDKFDVASAQGQLIAQEITKLLSAPLKPLTHLPKTELKSIWLDFDKARSHEEWETRAKEPGAIGYHAQVNLDRLNRGETLPTGVEYPVQSWIFGSQLAMVFLPGEVVVDYSLRLKSELDGQRLWINAYANDAPCYIPSERILKEGGYEGGYAMIYYDKPQIFAPGLEQQIIDTVHEQIPDDYNASKDTEGVPPKSPRQSLRTFKTHPELDIEIAAAEPLIASPVAIDWDAAGRMWVVEMLDYPTGIDGDWQPGGRVKRLEDLDGDGVYDRSIVFLEGLPFPTGVTAWGRGVLISAAPDIIYAEDLDDDGRPERVEKLFTGFAADNYQARVNSLSLGLDNWIYGANGLLGGVIEKANGHSNALDLDIRGHDFRFQFKNKNLQRVAGLTQQGRVRDDWGRWFGCDNGAALNYYPNPLHYFTRNPYVPAPPSSMSPPASFDIGRVYPISQTLLRFNDPEAANRITSGCGLGIYRDTLLGEAYFNNTFTCEPVHNLVHRLILSEENGQLRRQRDVRETQSEFFSSTDNWHRPVQVKTGPDGGLYVVDMYRFLVEHPRWIAPERLAQIDIRAGADMGRIYRIQPKDTDKNKSLRSIRDLTQLCGSDLASALDSPNGTERDRVQIELLHRQDKSTATKLRHIAVEAELPQTRIQSLSALSGLGELDLETLSRASRDTDARVRAFALKCTEPWLRNDESLSLSDVDLKRLSNILDHTQRDSDPRVVRQLSLSLGESSSPETGARLAKIALDWSDNPQVRSAILSSASKHTCASKLLTLAIESESDSENNLQNWINPLVATIAGSAETESMVSALSQLLPKSDETPTTSDLNRIYPLALALRRQSGDNWTQLVGGGNTESLKSLQRLAGYAQGLLDSASSMPPNDVGAAIRFLSNIEQGLDWSNTLCNLIQTSTPDQLRSAVFNELRSLKDPEISIHLLNSWDKMTPSIRQETLRLLLSRDTWVLSVLGAIEAGQLSVSEIPLSERLQLVRSSNQEIQSKSRRLSFAPPETSRRSALQKYDQISAVKGDIHRGAEIFKAQCALCHQPGANGVQVGPDLAPLRGKDSAYWIQNILDPNAIVEPRYIAYMVELHDGRNVSGFIRDETASGFNLVAASGAVEALQSAEVQSIQALDFSLMPTGLEQALPLESMADLLAYLNPPVKTEALQKVDATVLIRDPATLTRYLLDPDRSIEAREAVIKANPQFAADFISEMVKDLEPGTAEEYVRIPWIWRVAIACGKRNEGEQMLRVLEVALPEPDSPLLDWQSVVIGGGLINGISQRGVKPAERVGEILSRHTGLQDRWQRSLELAARMADDENVPTGTRYDALRMVAMRSWTQCKPQLLYYLQDGTNHELQMGAVSGLADVDDPQALEALRLALTYLKGTNRNLAEKALSQ